MSVINTEDWATYVRVSEQASAWFLEVMNYAEWEKGLDPIGASDMLGDLASFARLHFWDSKGDMVEPATIWKAFTESDAWKRYYPEDRQAFTGEQQP